MVSLDPKKIHEFVVDRAKERFSPDDPLVVYNHPSPYESAIWELNLARVYNNALDQVLSRLPRNYARVLEIVESLRMPYCSDYVEALYEEQYKLLNKKNLTSEDEVRKSELQKEVSKLPTGRDPWDQDAHNFLLQTTALFSDRIAGFDGGLEAAALIVCPDEHVEEERACSDIAAAIRALKTYEHTGGKPLP